MQNQISRPPGSWIEPILRIVCPKKVMKEGISPLIAELRLEYFEALAEGEEMRARFVIVRGYYALAAAVVSIVATLFMNR